MANVRVNPPIQKIPEFFEDPKNVPEELREAFVGLFVYLKERQHFDFQMWKRTGGGDDAIDDITSSDSFENSFSTGQLQEQVNDLEQLEDLIPLVRYRDFDTVLATSNTLAVNNNLVEGRNGVTIKMDPSPDYTDQIIIGNGDSSVITVDGNGIELRYKGQRDSTLIMREEGTFIHWYLFADGDQKYWRAS